MALPEEFHELAREVRNWGRWGDDDQVGTINLITDDVRRRATTSVQDGRAISLALPLDEAQGIQTGTIPGRANPVHAMTMINAPFTGDPSDFCTSDDTVHMGLQCATHWDGLGHVSYDNQLYNGYPADTITESGASRCGIHHVSTLVSRGVLLDVARAKGVRRLDGGYAIGPDDLDAAAELAGVAVEPGDVVLVRTGQMELTSRGDVEGYGGETAGPGMQAARWFRQHDVVAVATDNLAFEVFPCEREDALLPVHLLHIVDMGMTQGRTGCSTPWRTTALPTAATRSCCPPAPSPSSTLSAPR